MKTLFDIYKRDNIKEFNNNYKIKDRTHLINVASAIYNFDDAKRVICDRYKNRIDAQINSEYKKLENKVKENKEEMTLLIKCIMQAEKLDRHQIYDILDRKIIEKVNEDDYLDSIIKSKEQGRDIALSLAIIDDYMDYLVGKEYTGPTTLVNGV